MAVTFHQRRAFLQMLAAAAATGGLAAPRRASAATREAVIEAAKAESGLVWYDHYDRTASEGILADFQRAYPFVKKVEFVDVPSAQKTAKIMQESMAGGPTTDVLLHGAAVTQSLYDRGLLLEADWARIGCCDVAGADADRLHDRRHDRALCRALQYRSGQSRPTFRRAGTMRSIRNGRAIPVTGCAPPSLST